MTKWVSKAIEYYEQALSIAQNIGDRQGEVAAFGNLGVAYKVIGEPHKAVDFYNLQITVAREIEDKIGESIGLFNLGLVLYDLGEKNEAENLLKQALEISKMTRSPIFVQIKNTLNEWGVLE